MPCYFVFHYLCPFQNSITVGFIQLQYIEQKLSEIKDQKSKDAFLESIMNDPTATVLFEMNGHKTVLFPENKGPKTNTWEQTQQMEFELNKVGYDLAFIP